jgi:hypothetical protein
MTTLFVRQQDRNKDSRTHMQRREQNAKWLGPHERTQASQGTFYAVHAPAQLTLATAAELIDREEAYSAGLLALKDNYVSAGGSLARAMLSSSAKESGGATKPASSKRPRAKSAVPHAAAKLNDTLSRAWVDKQEMERRARSAAAMKQLLVEAQQVDSTTSSALEKAEKTVERITARSSQDGSRRKPVVEDGGVASLSNVRGAGAQDDSQEKVLEEGLFRSTLHKPKELDGRARVWDMSGGVHMGGDRRGSPVCSWVFAFCILTKSALLVHHDHSREFF